MGKSTLAQKLLDEKKIPYVSTDGLTVMLKPAGQPSFYSPEKAKRFYPYLDLFMSRMESVGPEYTIEGDSFSPEHVSKLKQKYELKCVYLIMKNPRLDNILKYAQHDNWPSSVSHEHLNTLVERIKKASYELEEQCEQYGIACYDLSDNYASAILRAHSALTS